MSKITLAEKIYYDIEEKIVKLEYKPGSFLTENFLEKIDKIQDGLNLGDGIHFKNCHFKNFHLFIKFRKIFMRSFLLSKFSKLLGPFITIFFFHIK